MTNMQEKLKSNYNLAKWLCFLVYIVTFVYSEWIREGSIIRMINTVYPTIRPFWLWNGLLCTVTGVVSLVVLYFVVRIFKYAGKFYILPTSETFLLTVIAFTFAHFIAGSLRLTYYITPVIYIWGHYLFGLIAGFPAMLWLNFQLKKRYLTPQSARYVFLWSMLTFLVINMAVTLYGGYIV